MSDHVISGLVRKRAELAGHVSRIRADLRAIDRALLIFGFEEPESIAPQAKRIRGRIFAPGELTALVGRAEREGKTRNPEIARWVLAQKDWPETRYKRVYQSVKDLRKKKQL